MWEERNLNATCLLDHKELTLQNVSMNLWELGNHLAMSAREVVTNHGRMAGSTTSFGPNTTDLELSRHWQFVTSNGPHTLFDAYMHMLEMLLTRALWQLSKVNRVNMALLIAEVRGILGKAEWVPASHLAGCAHAACRPQCFAAAVFYCSCRCVPSRIVRVH